MYTTKFGRYGNLCSCGKKILAEIMLVGFSLNSVRFAVYWHTIFYKTNFGNLTDFYDFSYIRNSFYLTLKKSILIDFIQLIIALMRVY